MSRPDTPNLQHNLRFFDRWASSYDHSLFQFWMKKFHVPILHELENKRNLAIVDLSCGTGQLLSSIYQQSGGNVNLSGVDISKEMLKTAKKRLPSSVKLYTADVHSLPFASNTFDYVLTTEAFHHYYDQRQALQEMKRVAKKGGQIIVVDVNFFFFFIHWIFQKFEPGCVKINSKKQMRQLFENAGLTQIVQQRSFLFSIMTKSFKP
ncbi:TPA: class I SAM-dependent methyltransferase [Candidatus Woesearchaeota archaeon]|nr:class I SAM-dependent methyltransferase [Candidatus Woesearchaeota archaeon]